MVDRIKQLLEWQQLTPTQFADRIGIGRPVVSHILSERNKPSLDVVQRIIAAFPELSMPWLLSGTGDMLAAGSQAAPAAPALAATPAAPSLPATPVAPIPTRAEALAAELPPAVPTAASIPAFRVATGAARLESPARPPQVVPPRFRPRQEAGLAPVTTLAEETAKPPANSPTGTALPGEPAAWAGAPAGRSAATVVTTAEELSRTEPIPTAGAAATGALPTGQNQAGGTEAGPAVQPGGGMTAGVQARPVREGTPPDGAALVDTLAAGFGEPGKAIRRIVIFYRDGSFADYQPEG